MAVDQKRLLKKKMANIMLQGLPEAGKSMLLDRLLKRPWQHKQYTSTGVSDNVVIVDIKPTSEASVAYPCSDSSWAVMDFEESVHSDLSSAVHTATEIPAAVPVTNFEATTDASGITHEVRDNIKAVLIEHNIKSMADFQTKSSLYIRDTGGQVEFQESLSFLLQGPYIFIFVIRTDKKIKEKNIFRYRTTSGKIINEYQSSISTMDALLQFLTTVAAIETTKKDEDGGYLTRRPVVFIVGTHIDLLGTGKDSVIKNINEVLNEAIQKQGFSHLVCYAKITTKEVMYTVDNTSDRDDSFQFLRSDVNQYIADGKEFTVECPTNYFLFCLRLQGIKGTTLSIDTCKQMAADVGIKPDEINHLLQFLQHNIGIIQHYNEKGLSDIIIKEPQILLDKLTDLLVKTFLLPRSIPQGLQTNFCQKGILEASAISKIICESKDQISPDQFLAYLVHLRMAVPFTDKHGDLKYFIPLVLNHVQYSSSADERKTDIAPLGISFRLGHCPKGLFAMLISHLLNPDEDSDFSFDLVEDAIYQDQVSLLVHSTEDVDEVTLTKHNSHLEINMYLQNSSSADLASKSELAPRGSTPTTVCSRVCSILQNSINEALKTLHYDARKVDPSLCLACTQKNCFVWHEVKMVKKYCYMYCESSWSKLKVPMSGQYWFSEGTYYWHFKKMYSYLFVALLAKRENYCIEDSSSPFPASRKEFSGEKPGKLCIINNMMLVHLNYFLASSVSIARLTLLKWTDSNGHHQTLRLRDEISPRWYDVGDLLGLDSCRVEGIGMQNSDVRLRCREVLLTWSEIEEPSYPWSWDGVLSLLEDLQLNQQKEKLQDALSCLKQSTE